jgi:hypothetical protein
MRTVAVFLCVLICSNALADQPKGQTIQVNLTRGQFNTYHFVPPDPPRAVILFGSGDGGWGYIENHASAFLQNSGFYVVGVDCREYAKSELKRSRSGLINLRS